MADYWCALFGRETILVQYYRIIIAKSAEKQSLHTRICTMDALGRIPQMTDDQVLEVIFNPEDPVGAAVNTFLLVYS